MELCLLFRHIGCADEQPTKAPIINNMPIVKILVFNKIQMVKIYVKRNIAQFVKTFNIKYTNFVTFYNVWHAGMIEDTKA